VDSRGVGPPGGQGEKFVARLVRRIGAVDERGMVHGDEMARAQVVEHAQGVGGAQVVHAHHPARPRRSERNERDVRRLHATDLREQLRIVTGVARVKDRPRFRCKVKAAAGAIPQTVHPRASAPMLCAGDRHGHAAMRITFADLEFDDLREGQLARQMSGHAVRRDDDAVSGHGAQAGQVEMIQVRVADHREVDRRQVRGVDAGFDQPPLHRADAVLEHRIGEDERVAQLHQRRGVSKPGHRRRVIDAQVGQPVRHLTRRPQRLHRRSPGNAHHEYP